MNIARIIWNSLKHPVTGLVIGVVLATLFFWFSRKTQVPVYAVSKPELMADRSGQSEELKIFWKERDIQNAGSIDVAFWNQGNSYIDQSDISTDDPITIAFDKGVEILSVNQLRRSRHDLEFSYSIENLPETQGITIAMVDDDALERHDGAVYRILFTGSLDANWKGTGRIKGVPNGFKEKKWSSVVVKFDSSFWLIVGISVFILITISLLFIFRLRTFLQRRRRIRNADPDLVQNKSILEIFEPSDFIFYGGFIFPFARFKIFAF